MVLGRIRGRRSGLHLHLDLRALVLLLLILHPYDLLHLGQGEEGLAPRDLDPHEARLDRTLVELDRRPRGGLLYTLLLERLDLLFIPGPLELLSLRSHLEGRALIAPIGVLALVPDGEEPVVLFLGDRIVFMAVALSATKGHTHPDLHRGVHAVNDRRHPELLVIGTALGVGHRIAMEARGDLLRLRRVRQHVAGELLNRELIEGHVGVDRPDHPVAVSPDGSLGVLRVAGGVSVASQVEPDTRPALSVALRGQQAIHQALIGSVALIVDKGIHLRDRRRQTGQVKREPANHRMTIRFGSRLQTLLVQPQKNKVINRGTHPVGIRDRRGIDHDERPEGPMRPAGSVLTGEFFGPIYPLVDPGAQHAHLGRGETLAPAGRHDLLRVRTRHQVNQHALGALASQEHLAGLSTAQRG